MMAKAPSFFIPPFVVKEKSGMICVVNSNDIAIGIYGNKEQADQWCEELNKKHPVKKTNHKSR
jgi:hypothetical protein